MINIPDVRSKIFSGVKPTIERIDSKKLFNTFFFANFDITVI